MSVERNLIIKYCHDYLKVENFQDYCLNGLQIEGAKKIKNSNWRKLIANLNPGRYN